MWRKRKTWLRTTRGCCIESCPLPPLLSLLPLRKACCLPVRTPGDPVKFHRHYSPATAATSLLLPPCTFSSLTLLFTSLEREGFEPSRRLEGAKEQREEKFPSRVVLSLHRRSRGSVPGVSSASFLHVPSAGDLCAHYQPPPPFQGFCFFF